MREERKKERKRIKMLRSIVFRQILLDIYLDSSRRFGPNFQKLGIRKKASGGKRQILLDIDSDTFRHFETGFSPTFSKWWQVQPYRRRQ